MQNFTDITGQRFTRLVVVSRAENAARGTSRWLCRCDCGREKVIRAGDLRSGDTKSCGCLRNEKSPANAKRKHGLTDSHLFYVWSSMIQRCYDVNSHAYARYGGRGIRVCDEWRESLLTFIADMGPRPKGLTLDRIDNDGDYTPANCRWATRKHQSNNRNRTTFVTAHGLTLACATWERMLGVSKGCVRERLKRGWTPEQAVAGWSPWGEAFHVPAGG